MNFFSRSFLIETYFSKDYFIIKHYISSGVNPNDIALMELENKLVLGDDVVAVNLPEKDNIPKGQSILSGWGSTSTGAIPSMPKKLQEAELPLISYKSMCNKIASSWT